jgi:hypothetical protein
MLTDEQTVELVRQLRDTTATAEQRQATALAAADALEQLLCADDDLERGFNAALNGGEAPMLSDSPYALGYALAMLGAA